MARLHVKRVYQPLDAADGQRVLVDRMWPRGIRKADLGGVIWLKDIGPSTNLRHWFGHRPARWAEFRKRYYKELDHSIEQVSKLRELMKRGTVTLLYSARDTEHNQAVALMNYLKRR